MCNNNAAGGVTIKNKYIIKTCEIKNYIVYVMLEPRNQELEEKIIELIENDEHNTLPIMI